MDSPDATPGTQGCGEGRVCQATHYGLDGVGGEVGHLVRPFQHTACGAVTLGARGKSAG